MFVQDPDSQPQSPHREAREDGVIDRRYKMRREIARGGHGAVFEAEHLFTHARVAIKTLVSSARDVPSAGPRLIREAQVLSAVKHPNVIAVHDAGMCPTHGPYVVLELVEGRPLDGILLARQSLAVGQTIAVLVQLCAALGAVHRRSVVHRDVKPGNLLIARAPQSDWVSLIDFGIAKLGAAEENESDKLTKSDQLIGTVEYMAPEQIMNSSPVDARSDVYSAGVIMYECLSGEVPYSGNVTAVITHMLAGTRPAPIRARRRDVPAALEAAVRKACEIDPAKRFASAEELAKACVAAVDGDVPVLDLLEMRRDQGQAASAAPALSSAPPPAAAPSHRRQFVRAPYMTPVRVFMAQGTTDGRTEDLSEGGLLMVTEISCGDGERVTLRFPLPVSGRVVELEAIAKWTKTRRHQRAIGAEFIAVPDDVRAEIRNYVALMASSGTAPLRG